MGSNQWFGYKRSGVGSGVSGISVAGGIPAQVEAYHKVSCSGTSMFERTFGRFHPIHAQLR